MSFDELYRAYPRLEEKGEWTALRLDARQARSRPVVEGRQPSGRGRPLVIMGKRLFGRCAAKAR